MRGNRLTIVIVTLGIMAVICGTANAAVGIIAETQTISGENAPVCTAPCECMAESTAAMRWGAEGYDRCSKSICGQSGNANVQYYCFHQVGGSTSSSLVSCQAPCECLSESGATTKWGTNGFSQCSNSVCGRDETTGGVVPRYCYRQWGSTLVIGVPTTAPAATTVPSAVQSPALTPAPATTTGAGPAQPGTPAPSYTWPAANAVPQRTPVGISTILAAIGAVLLVSAAVRKK